MPNITGHTELVGLMAYPIRHTQSPTTHNLAYDKNGISTWKWWSEFQAQRDSNFCLSGGLWSGPGHGGTGNEG